ncbi:hypothetical protein WR25_02726 [Diploscapter pachys]|uniref:Uncharacterized protein n=1 Tax=Diploscapter pachys TaxID=2018661 RepID=A0A2A2JQK9_9BILA|nr:hypothetical protein WR25_02726 [Diploscapter pachys]
MNHNREKKKKLTKNQQRVEGNRGRPALSIIPPIPALCTPPPDSKMDALQMRRLDVMPSFTTLEKKRYLQITSLDFNYFYNNSNPRSCLDRHILFKANRLLENNLDALMEMNADSMAVKTRKYAVFLKLGHISLLAQDWAKALSAYQQAYNLYPDQFWKHPSNYYGLGLVYLHFKDYKLAAEAFSRLLYCYPALDCIVEVKSRLGVCFQNLSEYTRALKFYNQACSDISETPFMSKIHIRFNIALANENLKELDKAHDEYNSLLNEIMHPSNSCQGTQIQLIASIHRQLGWIQYRRAHENHIESFDEKNMKLQEAEQFLTNSKKFEPDNGKTFYYLGRCYGETPTKAHDAFLNYRQSIDKSEADADTWCSIGVLYQQQNQPMDALQAFICAVELDPEHSAAWTDLGILYELHHQFADALECFRKAIKFNPGQSLISSFTLFYKFKTH